MKKKIKPKPYVPAMLLVLVATKDEEKLNFSTYGMFGQMSFDPSLIYISVQKNQFTAAMINKTKKFSVNIPNAQMLEDVKYCGSVSGAKTDKSKQFDVFYGENDVPMISKCPVNMNCELYQTIEMKNTFIFFGQVIESYADEECLLVNLPEAAKVDPLFCSLFGEFYTLGGKKA